jgi:diaminopimelate decarboxylase
MTARSLHHEHHLDPVDQLDHLHWAERRSGVADWHDHAATEHGFGETHPDGLSADRLVGPVATHLLPDTARIEADGRLSVGGVDVLGLVAEVGTPVFLYDEAHLRARCRQARQAFGGGVAYAAKAFLCRAMAALVNEEGLFLDVASGGELYVALRSGFPADRLVMHGSNKSVAELDLAIEAGVGRIVVDSFDEITRIEELARQHPTTGPNAWVRPRVLVRVNPGVVTGTHPSVATGQEDSKFGFSRASGAAGEAIDRLSRADSPVDLVGLHVHVGSQVLDLSTIERTVAALAELVSSSGVAELCVGGGLGVAYTSDRDPAPAISEWAAAIRQACRSVGIPECVRVTAEPGRAIVAAAAITCYTIGTIKTVGSGLAGAAGELHRTWVSVDGGMSDNPRPALYGSRYEAFLPGRPGARRPFAVTVAGKHCESGDIVVRHGHLPADVEVGDVLATPVTGAYGASMASNYNKVPRPPVVFVADGDFRVVTRRESYEDLFRLDI